MTIDQAVKELLDSEEFKQAAKNKSTLRSLATRFNNAELKSGAKVELLLQFDYKIEAKKPRILKYKKR
jgi:hypothetical protein